MREPRPIEYPAASRVRTGTLYPGPDTGRAVVVLHGLLAHRGLPAIDRLCRRLSPGFTVVSVDLKGHGDAPGRFTWGRDEHGEVADLVSFLHCLYPAVGVVGFSIGGAIAIASATLAGARQDNARPEALCVVGAPACLEPWRALRHPVMAARHYLMLRRGGRHRVRLGVPRFRWARAIDFVAGVAPIPLLLVQGTRDWLGGDRHARWLYERAGAPRELLLVDSAAHAEQLLTLDPEPLSGPLLAFFERTLGPGSARAATEVSLSRDRS